MESNICDQDLDDPLGCVIPIGRVMNDVQYVLASRSRPVCGELSTFDKAEF